MYKKVEMDGYTKPEFYCVDHKRIYAAALGERKGKLDEWLPNTNDWAFAAEFLGPYNRRRTPLNLFSVMSESKQRMFLLSIAELAIEPAIYGVPIPELKMCCKCNRELPIFSFHKAEVGSEERVDVCGPCRWIRRKVLEVEGIPKKPDLVGHKVCKHCKKDKNFTFYRITGKAGAKRDTPEFYSKNCRECIALMHASTTVIDGKKTCICCEKVKLVEDFHRLNYTKCGYNSKCIVCFREEKRRYYTDNRERIKITNNRSRAKHGDRWLANSMERAGSVSKSQKFCPRCKSILSVESFGNSKRSLDGLASYCKVCASELAKINNDAHRESYLAKRREYQEIHKERLKLRHKQWYENNREYLKRSNTYKTLFLSENYVSSAIMSSYGVKDKELIKQLIPMHTQHINAVRALKESK